MSEENDELPDRNTAYVLVKDHAEAMNMPEEWYLDKINRGMIEGFEEEGVWYMKPNSRPSAANREASTNSKASAKVRTVQVTGISIPFGDVLALTFKSAVAALIVFGIPALIFVLIAAS